MINGYSIFNGAKYFAEDGSQNYHIFQPLLKSFEAYIKIANAKIMAWKCKGLSGESINAHATADIVLIQH